MKVKLNSRIRMVVLVGICMLLFIQNFSAFSVEKLTLDNAKIESTSETDSESSEKITEFGIESVEFKPYAFNYTFFYKILYYRFSFLINYFSVAPTDGIEFPPEF
jgi:hypothetical protein